jgi:hypothetical protein
MGDVYPRFIPQTLCGAASGIENRPLRSQSQEPDSSTISDPHEEVKI